VKTHRILALSKRTLPLLLAAAGTYAIHALISESGAEVVGRALASAWPWVAALVLFEASVAAADASAIGALLGARAKSVSVASWFRSSALAVACAQLLPGGRVLGEVARVSALDPSNAAEGAALVLRAHGTYLLTISLSSFVCIAAVSTAPEPSALLSGLLLWSGLFNATLALLFLLGPRRARIGRFLGRRIGLLAVAGPRFDDAIAKHPVVDRRATTRFVLARVLRAGGSLVALFAILGHAGLDPIQLAASEAIQLVAANTGDPVPGQVGVLEGGYRLFASSLGLGDSVGLALAIALLFRSSRLIVAFFAIVIAAGLRCRMPPRAAAVAASLLALVASASSVRAQAAPTKLVVRQRAVAVVNPIGVEHMLALGMRATLSDDPSPLLSDAYVELGAVAYTSPIYSMTGGYLETSPLAFLVLRAQLTGMTLWSIGLDGAGFYPVDGYDVDLRAQRFPAATGRVASGFNAQVGAVVQGAYDLGPWRPILWNQLTFEHERLGEEDYHYSPKYDLVLARSDWMVANTAMVLLERRLGGTVSVRVGAYDDLRYVLASEALSHQAGFTAMLAWRGPSCFRELLVFGRAGVYLAPERRADQATGLVGVIARYDLADL
jgi:hypothetical protein